MLPFTPPAFFDFLENLIAAFRPVFGQPQFAEPDLIGCGDRVFTLPSLIPNTTLECRNLDMEAGSPPCDVFGIHRGTLVQELELTAVVLEFPLPQLLGFANLFEFLVSLPLHTLPQVF